TAGGERATSLSGRSPTSLTRRAAGSADRLHPLLAGDAPSRLGTDLETLLRERLAAIDALAVGPGVQPGQRLTDSLLLGLQNLQGRLLAVVVGQIGAAVGRMLVDARQLRGVGAARTLQRPG